MKMYSILGGLRSGFELEKYDVLHINYKVKEFIVNNEWAYFKNLNNFRKVCDDMYIVWFLDEKMINRYFEALKKRIINDIDEQINDLKKEKTTISNSKLIKEDET